MPQASGACGFSTRAQDGPAGIWFQGRNYKDANHRRAGPVPTLRQLCLYDEDMAFRKID